MQDNAALVLPGMSTSGRTVCAVPDCGKTLRSDNRNGFCRPHQQCETSRFPPRYCAVAECDRALRITNKSGYCHLHVAHTPNVIKANAERRARTVRVKAARPVCGVDDCTRQLYSNNKSGRCRKHTQSPLAGERDYCSIEGCGKRLNPRNRIGRCEVHRARSWMAQVCGHDDCDKKLKANNVHGFCQKHAYDYRRDYMLRHKYGMTSAEYDARLAEQGGACFLCGAPPTAKARGVAGLLSVDHDHETGAVRRLLCQHCNRGLGAFFDNPDLMRAAAAYVEKFSLAAAA